MKSSGSNVVNLRELVSHLYALVDKRIWLKILLALALVNLGVPTTGIALILGVDRILDMCRTVVNVTGDLTESVVMDKWLRER